jgi:hypothetical protein
MCLSFTLAQKKQNIKSYITYFQTYFLHHFSLILIIAQPLLSILPSGLVNNLLTNDTKQYEQQILTSSPLGGGGGGGHIYT